MSKGKKRSGARPGRPQPLRGTKGKRKGARLWYVGGRSEERRVGKEGRNRRSTEHLKKAQAARRLLEATQLDRTEMLNSLEDIIADVKRAAEVIQRLRDLLINGFFFASRRRHTISVSAFLLNRSSDLTFWRSPWSSAAVARY